MKFRRTTVSCVCAALIALWLCADGMAQVEQGFERIQFTPAREAAIRTKTNVVRGLLQGITRETVTVTTSVGTPREKSIDLPIKGVSSIRTNDGEFQYKEKDDFDKLCEYAKRLDGVTIEDARITPGAKAEGLRKAYGLDEATPSPNAGVNRPPVGGFTSGASSVTSPVGNTPPIGGFANSGGFGGTGSSTSPGTGSQPVPENSNGFGGAPANGTNGMAPSLVTEPASGSQSTVTPPTALAFANDGEIITCSNCKNEVAYNAAYGMRCPHCNIQWVADVPIPPPAETGTGGAQSGEVPAQGEPRKVAQGAQGNGGGPIQLPPPPPPPTNVGAAGPQGFDLATMPLWMKATFFLGSVGLIYYFAFYLR